MTGTVTHPIGETFPSGTLPTIFADGVLNVSISPAVVKSYLFRFEPSLQGDNQYQAQAAAQLIMPVDGFAAAVLFLSQHLERLVEANFITKGRVAELRGNMADAK